ncbi:MAG: phosphoadenylyl-sulfate reductase, partial [Spirochaetota bacterium]
LGNRTEALCEGVVNERLDLNLHVYQSNLSPARMEALYGRLWETGRSDDLDRYHHIRKVEPMQRALREVGASAWLSAVRRSQTENRRTLPLMSVQWGVVKVHPLLDWSDEDVQRYLADHDLPRHPLEYRGYRTVGDRHLSRPEETEDTDGRRTRFRGLREECGLHVPERTGSSIPIIPLDLRNEPESE